MSTKGKSLWPLAFIILVVTFVHVRSLETGYVYDDVEAILENPDLRRPERWPSLFTTNYWGARNIGLYRPMVQLSYLVDGAGFGFDARVSHGINLAMHLLVVGLLFGLVLRLTKSLGVAGVSALAFGVSPALLDANTWISGRTDVMAAAFVLIALHCMLRVPEGGEVATLSPMRASGPGQGWICLAAISYLLGLWSKEMAVTLPALAFMLPVGLRPRFSMRWWPLGVAFIVYVIFRSNAVEGVLPEFAGEGGVVFKDRDLLARAALGSRALFRLLALLVVPYPLAADHRAHPFAASDAEPGLEGVLCLGLGLWLFYFMLRKRRSDPVVSFFGGGLLLSLLPVLQIIPIGAVMAERFLYLPAIFLYPLVIVLGQRGLKPWPAVQRGLCLVLIAGMAVLCIVRIPLYTDRGSWCRDVLSVYPKDHRILNNLGVYHFLPLKGYEEHRPDFDRAKEAFDTALDIEPFYRKGRLNRVRVELEEQRVKRKPVKLELIESLLKPLLKREDPNALYLKGKAYWRTAQAAKGVDRNQRLEVSLKAHLEAAAIFNEYRDNAGLRRRAAAAFKEAGLAARELKRTKIWRGTWERALRLEPKIGSAQQMRRALRK